MKRTSDAECSPVHWPAMLTRRFTAVRSELGEGELDERLPVPLTGTIAEAREHARRLKLRRDWLTIRAKAPLPSLQQDIDRLRDPYHTASPEWPEISD